MKVRCFHTLREMAPFRDEVNALNLSSSLPDPFSTFEYYENLILYGRLTADNGWRVWFLAAFEDERLIGYMALKEKTRMMWGRRVVTLCFLTEHDADRPHVVAHADDVPAVTAAFYGYLNSRREWDFLELQQQDESSTLYPLPKGVRLRGCWVKEWPTMDNFTIHFRWRTHAEYYQSLSKKVRADIRRGIKRLFAAGRLELLSSSDPSATPALLDLYRCIEVHSWKTQAKLSIGSDPVRTKCVRGLLEPHHPMRPVIHVLLLDGVPIAGLISGSFTTSDWKGLYAMHIVFDDRCMVAAPGSAILLLASHYAMTNGYRFLNLLSGFGHYKNRWLATGTPTRSAQIYRIGRIPFWRRVLGEAQRWTLKFLRPKKITGDPTEDRQLYNPTRRELIDRDVERTLALETTPAERAHFATLISRARMGRCEYLSSTELAATMPFAVSAEEPSQASAA